ncbi:MAG: SBBP repeat-containing protein, partial [bacterium]
MINSICKYICIVILLILCGCSGSKSTPVEPTSEIPDALSTETNSTHSLMGIWDVEFDVESMEASVVQNRDPMYHFNVGSFLPPPIVGINSWDAQSEIVDVDVVIRNTSIYDGYDVRMIVFYDDARHRLMNADNFTHLWDIPQGFYANGFKAYAKSEPYRKFRSLQLKMENFQILCPNSNFNVQIAIDASYPGNCSEPYLMDNFRQGALIEYVGATADVRVDVYDWQNDVDSVRIQCHAITGEPDTYFTQEGSKTWKLDLVNNTGASEGEYRALLVTTSANSGTLQLLDEVVISVYTADNIGWARTWGGVGNDYGQDIAVDNVGNVYVTGDFSNTVDFNPDPAEEEWRTSIAPASAFLSKFDKYGDFKWVNTFGDIETAGGNAIETDEAGNIFTVGTFHNTVDFNPGVGVDEHTSNGKTDIFLSKYAPNGDYLGTVTWGGSGTDHVTEIIIDNQNNVSATGYFE